MTHDFILELSFMNYIMAEISRGKYMELEEDKYTEKREKVYTFMKIPREFEKVDILPFVCFLLVLFVELEALFSVFCFFYHYMVAKLKAFVKAKCCE